MNARRRRPGLQAWLVTAFVAMGLVASVAALVVVLPNLEGSIRKDQAQRQSAATIQRLQQVAALGLASGEAQPTVATLASTLGADVRLSQISGPVVEVIAATRRRGYLGDELSPSAVSVADPQSNVRARSVLRRINGVDVIQAAVAVRVDGADAVLEIGEPVEGTAARLALVRRRVLIAMALVLLLATLTGIAIARVLGARIRRLAGTASTLAAGDLSARAADEAPAELTSLAESLNLMAARLEGLVEETVSDRDRAEGLVASLAEGVVAVSPRGEVTVANRAAQTLLSLPSGAQGLRLDDLPPAVREAVDEARPVGMGAPVVEATFRNGVEATLQATRISGQAGVVVTIRDVTMERRLARARRDLIANVSHELKTPLTAVKGFLELLESEHLSAVQRAEFVGLMTQEVGRLERLIAEQLELARLDAGALPLDRERVDLGELAAEVAESRRLLADREGVELVASVPPMPVLVDADPARVEQILLILLDNAVKHTPAGGKITVAVGSGPFGGTISVRDTGTGIPGEAQPFIFDRFYQADQSREGHGLGLGLSIARGLAEAHGGSIEVRSAPGVGSVFTVRLPLAAPADVASAGK